MVVGWSSGDQVKINGTQCSLSNINVDYAEINVGSASSPYYAVYPYSSSNTASASGGSVTIPSSQTYSEVTSGSTKYQKIDAPMAGIMPSGGGVLRMRNIASLLRIAVMNGNENSKTFTVNSITVTASDGVKLSGTQPFTFNGDTRTNELTGITTLASGGDVTLTGCDAAGAIAAGDMKVFNIVVAPYDTDCKLTITVNGTLQGGSADNYTITQNTARTLSHGEVAVQFFATNFDR